ncbi:S-adenosyl-L-methionine-dependent methyltransferase [Phascolomyces articulosus]|uniref:S-adenosyl-L-methionine-dependent methyltransferase n=1 Tax=Phascolomyces articulosus TaxID=60185 RepID=A0AAD5JWW3_9FUNG|nr:S-adenosyl-L-methionine-dependent methyltransferase [Phascolomyces articulosus]
MASHSSDNNKVEKPQPIAVETPNKDEEQYEEANVHQVYQEIASHFSETRYKPWPVVETFLNGLPTGSLGADVGCGNGKYIGVNPNILMLGSDRSANLIEIVHKRGFEGMVADGLNLPYRDNSLDFAVSIAVIHHFSTPERRKEAIQELLRIIRPGGKILIFVWALEQTKFSKRNFEPGKQDVFVPWMLKSTGQVYNRYYHLFQKGELDGLFDSLSSVTIETSGYDRDNHYIIATKQ